MSMDQLFYEDKLQLGNGPVLSQATIESGCLLEFKVGDAAEAKDNSNVVMAYTEVIVNGQPAQFVEGEWKFDDAGAMIWDPSGWVKTLRFESSGRVFELRLYADSRAYHQADIVRIAESLK